MEPWLLVPLTLLLSAFFSGVEIAFFTANPFKVELDATQGDRGSRLVTKYIRNPNRFLTTLLVGNTLAVVVYGSAAARLIQPWLRNWGIDPVENPAASLLIQTGLSTLAILVLAEYLPKVLFRLQPNRMLSTLGYAIEVVYRALWPVVRVVDGLTRLIVRRYFRAPSDMAAKRGFSSADLYSFIQQHYAGPGEGAQEIAPEVLTNALEFNTLRVRDFMIPRTEIEAVEVNASLSTVKARFVETELSRLVVYEGTLDQVVGYVHIRDILRRPDTLANAVQDILVVPEGMTAQNLLQAFNEREKSLAVVLDEFGGTAGLVTVEDLVEEIVGEIEDEHDELSDPDLVEEQLGPGHYRFSTRLEIDRLNALYNLDLPEGDYATLGGWIMDQLERIPTAEETFELGAYHIKVVQAAENKLEVVEMTWDADLDSTSPYHTT